MKKELKFAAILAILAFLGTFIIKIFTTLNDYELSVIGLIMFIGVYMIVKLHSIEEAIKKQRKTV